MALDREIERMARETPPEFSEGSSENVLTPVRDDRELLSEYVEGIKPASTIQEMEAQVHQAKLLGADSIEVTKEMYQFYCGPNTGSNPSWDAKYFHFKNVKAYLAGSVEEAKKVASLTMEQKIFGGRG